MWSVPEFWTPHCRYCCCLWWTVNFNSLDKKKKQKKLGLERKGEGIAFPTNSNCPSSILGKWNEGLFNRHILFLRNCGPLSFSPKNRNHSTSGTIIVITDDVFTHKDSITSNKKLWHLVGIEWLPQKNAKTENCELSLWFSHHTRIS